MNGERRRPALRSRLRPASLACMALATLLLGLVSGFPGGFGFLVAGGAVVLAVALRLSASPVDRAWAPVPVLGALLVEAVAAPIAFGAEVLAGFAGIAFFLWVADDPARPLGGAVRSFSAISVPALALGIAWGSALFLPAGNVPLGVAGAVLVVALAAVALLLARPESFDREA